MRLYSVVCFVFLLNISLSFYAAALDTNTTSLDKNATSIVTCRVDYHGTIHFRFSIVYDLVKHASLFFKKSNENTWKLKERCRFLSSTFECEMNDIFDVRENEYINFSFYLQLQKKNGSVINITNFESTSKLGVSLMPWENRDYNLFFCERCYGTKLMNAQVSYRRINLTWVVFPLTRRISKVISHIDVLVNGKKKISETTLDSFCPHQDSNICRYDLKNVKPCSSYNICILTYVSQYENYSQMDCREEKTYCYPTEFPPSLLKQSDYMFITFGATTVIIISVFCFVKYRRQRRQNVVDDNTLVEPRKTAVENDNELRVYMYPSIVNEKSEVYKYSERV